MLHPVPVPEWKWEQITMDIVTGLPQSQHGHDAVWVVVDLLNKVGTFPTYAHDVVMRSTSTVVHR